jgi:hypothetical protein
VYTIFSLVSTTILQTFNYDDRLKIVTGESYLIADYTIKESDPDHRAYVAYAAVMFMLYCVGIPAASFYLLRKNKPAIQELQKLVYELAEKEEKRRKLRGNDDNDDDDGNDGDDGDDDDEEEKDEIRKLRKESPMLRGLAPLYQDYEAEYYYFEVIQFIATLFLVAVAASLPVDSGSVVFLALMASGTMLLAFAWWKPYVGSGDDRDAFLAQMAITMTLCVGLLSLSASDDDPEDWAFGWLLMLFTAAAVSVPFGIILDLIARLILVYFYDNDPEALPEWLKFIRTIYTNAKAAADRAQDLVKEAINSHPSQAGSAPFHSIFKHLLWQCHSSPSLPPSLPPAFIDSNDNGIECSSSAVIEMPEVGRARADL